MLKKRWLIPSALDFIFFLWYTNISGPMSEAEINTVIGRIDSGKTSISAEDREDFLKFLTISFPNDPFILFISLPE